MIDAAQGSSGLRISLLGSMAAEAEGEPIILDPTSALSHLWAYLLLHRRHPLPRKHVAFTLWPDMTEAAALAQLRRQLHVLLHRTLPAEPGGRPWVIAERTTIQWNREADDWLDVREFTRRCSAARAAQEDAEPHIEIAELERGLGLYSGPLLSDLDDAWALAERERLSRMRAEALRRLLLLHAGQGDARVAAATARTLVDHDELCEESHRLAIGLAYLAGDRGFALEAYGRCTTVLAERLDVAPMPETEQLVEAVRTSLSKEHVLRLLEPDLPTGTDLTALLPAKPSHNLPSLLTRFIGRERALAELTRLLAEQRMLTLTGAGGCGKSRLALEVAARIAEGADVSGRSENDGKRIVRPEPVDGVWWADLAPIDVPALVPQTVSMVLGLSEEPGVTFTALLERELRDRTMLLVLDNAEHVAEACAALVEGIVGAAPGIRVLVTSREPLGLSGERTWLVPPLSVPTERDGCDLASLMRHEATQLFVDRARLKDPSFGSGLEDGSNLASLCRRLEGIPLAIELAAAHVPHLTLAQIMDRHEDRLAVLGSTISSLDRHQTMRATVEWSYDLLDPPEQVLLRRLSVFRGGWTPGAAEAVCADGALQRQYVPVLLNSLLAKSMLVADTRPAGRRYRMLQTIRSFALDRMRASDELEAVRERHLAFFVQLAETAEPELNGADGASWMARLQADENNLRSALEWAAQRDRPTAGLRLAVATWIYWDMRGGGSEGRSALERLLALPKAQGATSLRAEAFLALGNSNWASSDYDAARSCFEQGLAINQALEDPQGIAACLSNLGLVAWIEGDFEAARAQLDRSLSIRRGLGDQLGVAKSVGNLAIVAEHQGDFEAAVTYLEEDLRISRAIGNRAGEAAALGNLGNAQRKMGDPQAAWASYEQGLEIDRALRNRRGVAMDLNNMGELAREQNELERARAYHEESLAIDREVGDRQGVAMSLGNLGNVARDQGRYDDAFALQTEALSLMREIGAKQYLESGIEAMANTVAFRGDGLRAARLLGASESLRKAMGSPRSPAEDAEVEAAMARARRDLGDSGFESALEEGRGVSPEDATAYALGEPWPAA